MIPSTCIFTRHKEENTSSHDICRQIRHTGLLCLYAKRIVRKRDVIISVDSMDSRGAHISS